MTVVTPVQGCATFQVPSQVQVQGHGASEDVCLSRQRHSVGSTTMRDRFCLGQSTFGGAGGEEASVELDSEG